MNTPKWQFAQSMPGIRENEQTQEEFFSNAEVVSEVAGLVRESIQNSLDEVKDKSKPVRMVFTVGTQQSGVTSKYFADLYPHLESAALPDLPDFESSSKYLVIEDFNTLGLEGPTTSKAPPEVELVKPPYKRSFWFFEWKTGASNKSAGNRGSWGVGKIVFPRASKIKSYLVLSVRSSVAAPDGDSSILFGHSILKYRFTNGVRYVPDCQWMITDAQGLPIPSPDFQSQVEFSEDWDLVRQPNEFGTSIVVPFCQESLTKEQLVRNIIRDYFIAVLSGLLECEVRDNLGNSLVINKDNLDQLIEAHLDTNSSRAGRAQSEMKSICSMYRRFLNDDTYKFEITINPDAPNDWDQVQIDDTTVVKASEAYENGQVVQVQVRTHVPAKKNPNLPASDDEFMVLLQRSSEVRSSTVFCREGILIPNANKQSAFQNRISMVFVGDLNSAGSVENSLANMLKNAEGPSHETWSTTASKFRGRYMPHAMAERTLRWVKQSVDRTIRLIESQDEVQDDTTWNSYFPSEDDGDQLGVVSLKLYGKRSSLDPTKAILSWGVNGFEPTSYDLKQLSPNIVDLLSGEGTGSGALIDMNDLTKVYKYQVSMTDGKRVINSNIVTFAPESPDNGEGPKRADVEVFRVKGGFAIRPLTDVPLSVGYRFKLVVQYESRGQSKSKWESGDFVLEELRNTTANKGLKIEKEFDNCVELTVKDPNIYMEWVGFDELRDLKIHPEEIQS